MLAYGKAAALVPRRIEAADTDLFRTNNFDLIRLCVALQVAISHGLSHLGVNASAELGWLSYFPGVPVFFFVSGFLISRSYESAGSLGDYLVNRTLRIYPALVVCTLASLLALLATGYLSANSVGIDPTVAWVLGQITIFQFYNPDFLRGFGIGVVNGSLWTIAIELQFYVLVPIVYGLIRRVAPDKRGFDAILVLAALVFLCINVAYFAVDPAQWNTMSRKLLGVSFIPWLYMFLLGVMGQRSFCPSARIGRFPRPHLPRGIRAIVFPHRRCGPAPQRQRHQPPSVSPAGRTGPVLRLFDAETGGHAAGQERYLLWHLHLSHADNQSIRLLGHGRQDLASGCCVGNRLLAAFLSWRLVERPALSKKSHPFYPVAAAGNGDSKGIDR